jgi:hypothetical protein
MNKIIYIFISILLLIQNKSKAQDTIWVRGVRLGYAVSSLALPFINTNRKAAVEFSIDTEWKPGLFPTGELGFENDKFSNDNINYRSNSIYLRAGYDRNMLKPNHEKLKDMFFYGFRYGFSLVHQETLSYTMADSCWGSLSGSFPAKTLQHHWAEFGAGVRVAITSTIFMGFTGRVKLMLFRQKDLNYPYIVPGFGNGANKMNFGFDYSLYFMLPLKKVKLSANTLKK